MERLGFLYDTTRCTGCKACQVACKEQNKSGTGDFFRRVDTMEAVIDGEEKWVHFSGACNHCKNPSCVEVCPTGAMYLAEDGTVQHKNELCIGCGRCVHHCPYGAPSLNKVTGYAQKCDACAGLRDQGRNPACVDACPVRALHFGPLAALQKEYGGNTGEGISFLPPSDLTEPSLLLRSRGEKSMPVQEEEFSLSQEHTSGFLKNTDEHFVILGGGIAAVSAAKAIRLRNTTAKIQIISDEKHLPYSRPMLSKGFLNSFSSDAYPVVTKEWLDKQQIELKLGQKVTELDTEGKNVTLENGEKVPFDKCIYALGSRCFVPPIPGHEKKGVFSLRSGADLDEIRKQMLLGSHAVIIGGGITGLELAWEMKKAGLQVTVVDLAPVLMGRLLDEESSKHLRTCIEEAGISVVTDAKIREINGETAAENIVLEDGRRFPAELVVISAGYRANVDIAGNAGLSVDNGVVVSEMMETSCQDIYACGDCTAQKLSTWMQSCRQGETAGANAAGDKILYHASAEPAMVHTAGTSLLTVGDMGKNPEKRYRIVYGHQQGETGMYTVNPGKPGRTDTFFAFAFESGKLVGAVMIGNLKEMRLIEESVQKQCDEQIFYEQAVQKGIEFYDK